MCRSRPSLTTTFAMPSSSAIRNGTAPKTSPASLPKRSGLSKWLLITRVMFSAGTTTMSLTSCSQQRPPQAREVLTMTDTALEALSTEDERLREPVAWQRRCLFPDKHTKEKPQWQDCLAMEVKSWPQHDYQYRPLYADPLPLT